MKKTLKALKEDIANYLEDEDYSSAIDVCNKIINYYPKNKYGYLKYIELKTNKYKSYLKDDEIKELKKIYDIVINIVNKEEKETLKKEFELYLNDIKEVENLKKVKKDIITNELLKLVYSNMIISINENIEASKKYNLSGKKITNVYDLIKGLFYVSCLIYNIFNINKLLFITAPFGVFGLIIIYSFITTNFLGKEKLLSEKNIFKKNVKKIDEKIKNIKKEIDKKNDTISSLRINKKDNILKIPKDFNHSIKNIIDDNEEDISTDIINSLSTNNLALFTYLVNENTNLEVEELLKIINDKEISSLENLMNKKEENKKSNQNEILLIQNIKSFPYILTIFLIVISVFSLIIIIRNFGDLDIKCFTIGLITGVITTFIYNIVAGKHKKFSDTFNDNLLSTIFNASLVYDLVYYAKFDNLGFIYGFIKIPMIYILLLTGLVSITSILKYKNLINKLRK